jgi:hypothetical protein
MIPDMTYSVVKMLQNRQVKCWSPVRSSTCLLVSILTAVCHYKLCLFTTQNCARVL